MALERLPVELHVTWYQDPADAVDAAPTAEVFWFDPMTAGPMERLLEAAGHLRWVSCQRVGVDDLPLAELLRRKIRLTNGAGLYANPIAEYLMMALLSWAKGLPDLIRAQEHQDWLTEPPADRDIAGSKALIVGYGATGRAVDKRLRAFGVSTVGVRSRAQSQQVIGPNDWRSRLNEFDFVLLCAPLTPNTRHLIGQRELAAMKPGGWLANVSRGGLVDTQAVVLALQSGRLGGAYLDVTEPEPLPIDHPLWRIRNVMITPHSSWASNTFFQRTSDFFLANLGRYLSRKPLRNLVNLRLGY